jgi:hypothetical protein
MIGFLMQARRPWDYLGATITYSGAWWEVWDLKYDNAGG